MAYFFGLNVGAGIGPAGVTEQSTTTGKDVEVVINTNANVPNREQLSLVIQALQDYIMGVNNKNW
jgi:predicted nuclease of predicted toxin-antitoxin system